MAQECKNINSLYHSSESCCKIVYDKCTKEILQKLQTPLENLYPQIFGDIDTEQRLLIKNGSSPVVILENASEFVSQMKNIPGFIEQIIKFIIDDNKSDFKFLGSHAFPLVVKDEFLDTIGIKNIDELYNKNNDKQSLSYKYDELLKIVKPKVMPKKAVLHIALDMRGDVGHYGIAIKNDDKVLVFDSMQCDGRSGYTGVFSQIIKDVFGIVPKVKLNPTCKNCPQITGGFVSPQENDEKLKDYLYRLQNMDSQNHFCYLWAIWYFHIYIKYGHKKLETIFEEIYKKSIPPLCVIKRYIWSIIHSFYPNDKKLINLFKEIVSIAQDKKIDKNTAIFLFKYFILNFRYIWYDLNKGQFNLYAIIECDLQKFRSMHNINECLSYSIEKFEFIVDNISIPKIKFEQDNILINFEKLSEKVKKYGVNISIEEDISNPFQLIDILANAKYEEKDTKKQDIILFMTYSVIGDIYKYDKEELPGIFKIEVERKIKQYEEKKIYLGYLVGINQPYKTTLEQMIN